MTKFGVLGHLLLGLLASGERTGYELTRQFDVSLANVWAASHSQIYPELAKLEAAALIRKTDAGPRGSQRYAITAEGLTTLKTWLAETRPAESPRAEWMARVFFLGLVSTSDAEAYLNDQRRRHIANVDRYGEFAEHCAIDNPDTRWQRIAIEAGLRYEAAMADWAAWAIAELHRTTPA